MFGQRLRSDSDFWKLVHEAGIEDEENLPTPADKINNDIIDDVPDNEVNINNDIDNEVNMNNDTDNEVAELVIQLSDNVHSYSSKTSSSKLIIT